MSLGRLFLVGALALVLLVDRVHAQYSCPDQGRFWDPGKCTAVLEQRVLTRFPGLFTREGQRLTVTFANGKKQVFVSGEREKDRGDSYVGYIFQDYFPKIQYGLVGVGYYEGWTDLLLNMKTGESVDIEDHPVFSPGGLRFAVARDDGMIGRGVFAVYSITESGVGREYYQEMDKRAVKNLKWLGDDAISFVSYRYASPDERPRILKREAGAKASATWKIQ